MQTIAPELAELAALIADPGRAGILSRLMKPDELQAELDGLPFADDLDDDVPF